MAYELRDFSDVAPATTLASDITNVATALTLTSGTGYPSGGAAGDFIIQIESELIRCSVRSGASVTVSGGVAGRGINGTTAVAHVAGVTINHVHTAVNDSKEANYAVSKTVGKVTTNQDLLVADAANSFTRLGIGANGTILQAVAGSLAYGALGADTVTSTQIANSAVGNTELAALSVDSGKLAANAVILGKINAAAVDASALASDAVTTIKILDSNVTAGKIASDAVTTIKILDSNVTTAKIADANITIAKFASGMQPIRTAAGVAPGTPVAGQQWYDTTNNLLHVYNGSAWVCITPISNTVLTEQTTSGTGYTNLTTTGPTVTITTGTKALITLTCRMTNSGTNVNTYMSAAVSGATTATADTLHNAGVNIIGAFTTNNGYVQLCSVVQYSSLTAGSNVFTAKYHVDGNTGTFSSRSMTVVGIP